MFEGTFELGPTKVISAQSINFYRSYFLLEKFTTHGGTHDMFLEFSETGFAPIGSEIRCQL